MSLPRLSQAQLIKLKHLTILTLAAKSRVSIHVNFMCYKHCYNITIKNCL